MRGDNKPTPFWKGYNSFLTKSNNPYPVGSEDYKDWNAWFERTYEDRTYARR